MTEFVDPATVDFNPHEREARDAEQMHAAGQRLDFNPHEREARDGLRRCGIGVPVQF